MGGLGSGRTGGRPTVESAYVLEIGVLARAGALTGPGGELTLSWRRSTNKDPLAEGTITTVFEEGSNRIRISLRRGVKGHQETLPTQFVWLEKTVPPFGGSRWWFVCPRADKRVSKLYLPPGARVFASREGHQLGYMSQRETSQDRAFRRARRLRQKIGGDDSLNEPLPCKPKGMRWRTYWRHRAACEAADQATVAYSYAVLERLE
jgi:hypothetical protein